MNDRRTKSKGVVLPKHCYVAIRLLRHRRQHAELVDDMRPTEPLASSALEMDAYMYACCLAVGGLVQERVHRCAEALTVFGTISLAITLLAYREFEAASVATPMVRKEDTQFCSGCLHMTPDVLAKDCSEQEPVWAYTLWELACDHRRQMGEELDLDPTTRVWPMFQIMTNRIGLLGWALARQAYRRQADKQLAAGITWQA